METIILGIISSTCYSILQKSVTLIKDNIIPELRRKFIDSNINIDDDNIKKIANDIENLDLDPDYSESKISKEIQSNNNMMQLLKEISTNKSITKTTNINNSGTIFIRDINM
ncbi:hypothetical protein [Morganella morganii]|uniref:hypothetical protein n=1 Tax=Morganella morganii TaxID=582 RepID=UPI001BD9859A|nr:hypothetical protein [Morganella morganii]MBT0422576.1 hypothetical protein [Morganella morganii subsp. morganii]MBT0517173.1 hypothetical protein [Morganella morganii subsp. morganii]QWM03958.1 hypothetical protein IZ185_17930 [Morganella morganii subsp. morganii]